MDKQTFAAAAGRTLDERGEFVASTRLAIAQATPFAAAKLGSNEGNMLIYTLLRQSNAPRASLTILEQFLLRRLPIAGLFPLEPGYIMSFAQGFATALAEVDWLGLGLSGEEALMSILQAYTIAGKLMAFQDQEPDRSTPSCDACCWLPALAGKRILLVNPFAEFLASRATQDCFEAVWAKTGKPWFFPKQVDALEFPYGFLPETQATYGTLDRLLDTVTDEMARRDYDVALIGAGAMSLQLAVAAKQQGKVGIALGGHLQVLFGVLGNRWRTSVEYQARYINDAWVDLPARYVPPDAQRYENSAYW